MPRECGYLFVGWSGWTEVAFIVLAVPITRLIIMACICQLFLKGTGIHHFIQLPPYNPILPPYNPIWGNFLLLSIPSFNHNFSLNLDCYI
jgi:hypothetical protein